MRFNGDEDSWLLKFDCPSCHAKSGESCRRLDGPEATTYVHKKRSRLAFDEQMREIRSKHGLPQ